MGVKAGDKFRRANEDEPYRYEFVGYCYESRSCRKVKLKNCETGLVFEMEGVDFKKWYEPEELKTIAKEHVGEGGLIRGLEDGKTYRCVKDEWYDPWTFDYWEFENVETGEKLIISSGDKSGAEDKYYRLTPPGKFKESRIYEDVWRLCAHFEPVLRGEVDMEKDKFKKWVEELKGFHGLFTFKDLVEIERFLLYRVYTLVRKVGVWLKEKLREEDGDVCAGGVPEFAGNNEWRYVQRWYYHMSLFYLLN